MQTPARVDVVIVGGGIVGLSVAQHVKQQHPGLRMLLIEKENEVARHQTGRNSGVIHSGIYYTPGSLKAKLCVDGAAAMYRFCADHAIPVEKRGKIIVASTEEEIAGLEEIFERGLQNEVPGIERLTDSQITRLEPVVIGRAGILCPSTGIVDFAQVARALKEQLEGMGVRCRFGDAVAKIHAEENGSTLVMGSGEQIRTRSLITCVGLHADRLAVQTGGRPDPKIIPFRGDYYVLKPEKARRIKRMIYPVPAPNVPFLGVHVTPRIDGQVWFGPNAVFAFGREAYSFGSIEPRDLFESLAYDGFHRLARRYWKVGLREFVGAVSKRAFVRRLQALVPGVEAHDCLPGPSGVRAMAIREDGTFLDDFLFDRSSRHVLHVRNAPSPAATSALAIGRHIAEHAAEMF